MQQTFFRYPPDSPFREQRLAGQQGNPETVAPPVAPVESPRERLAKTLKGVGAAVSGSPEVRDVAEKKVFELRAKQAVNSAFKKACENRTFARENGGNKYNVFLDADNKLVVGYSKPETRQYFVSAPIDVGAPGQRMDQATLKQTMEDLVASPEKFGEIIATGPNTNND
jgi:hypothetical protein